MSEKYRAGKSLSYYYVWPSIISLKICPSNKAAGLCIKGATLLKLYVSGVSSSAILCHLLIRICLFSPKSIPFTCCLAHLPRALDLWIDSLPFNRFEPGASLFGF